MKANELSCRELMVGDLVMYNPNVFVDDEYESTKDYYPIQISNGEDIDLAIEGCYQPIPLTPEILEKNGWVYIAEDKVFYSENLKGELPWICYITDGSNEVFRMQDFCNLKYVHQLQHALRLCGIEKEIIL